MIEHARQPGPNQGAAQIDTVGSHRPTRRRTMSTRRDRAEVGRLTAIALTPTSSCGPGRTNTQRSHHDSSRCRALGAIVTSGTAVAVRPSNRGFPDVPRHRLHAGLTTWSNRTTRTREIGSWVA